jgi:hypothetical protein
MNDYYPFLVEKISKLDRNGEVRRTVYKSAREELVTKLASPALRMREAEIARERRALDAAIHKIEAELEHEGISEAGAIEPGVSRTSPNSSSGSQITTIASESAPAILVGKTTPDPLAPTMPSMELAAPAGPQGEKPETETPQADPTSETFRTGGIRVLPWDAGHDSHLRFNRRGPGAVAQAMGKQLVSMVVAIVVCCFVFAAIYFSAGIVESFGH